ncbi:MAG TPA: sugar phosphate isomerase/epimerase family protein [Abditibacteriaceae bacterium]|jgi:sugar phosphate isomerase/epimerase
MKFPKLLLSAVLALSVAPAVRAADPLPENLKTGEFFLGCQAWTFNRFTTFEAIEKTKASGAKLIEMYPGQKMMAGSETKVGPGMSAEDMQKLKDKLNQEGIKAVAFGVTGIGDENNARKLFQWAKDMGIGLINTEDTGAIDTIEKMVKEFDIKVAFHEHARQENNANYRLWDPVYVRDLIKDRDKRIGACADTGHWVRSGLNPVYCLRVLEGRILGSHLKDLNYYGRNPQGHHGHDLPFGTGVSDIAGILDELKRQNFNGPISVEYEHKMENNLPEVTQSVAFVRDYKPKK